MLKEHQNKAREFITNPSRTGKVAIVGDLGLDSFVFGHVDRISPEAPVPVLSIEKSFDKLGCAANVAANVAEFKKNWPLELSVYGVLGADPTAQLIKNFFSEMCKNIKTHFIADPQRVTPKKIRYIAGSQHQLLRVDEESTSALPPTIESAFLNELQNNLSQHDVVVVQDYAKGLLTPKLFQNIFQTCRASKTALLT
jgi:D-beta-D-heptose 7-phosphate kinase/D-beta-D-heptose 1-phosphate adenosyltransferase